MNNSITDVLKNLGCSHNSLSLEALNSLDENGYFLIKQNKNIIKYLGQDLEYMRNRVDELIEQEGEHAGYEGREEYYKKGKFFEPIALRLGNLLNKDRVFINFVMLPDLLWSAYHVIKRDLMLSSCNFREPLKGSGQQRLHIDWEPILEQSKEYESIIAMMYLDDSTKENGAIKIIPKTHKLIGYPDEYCNPYLEHKDSLIIEAEAGSILVINGNVWHRGSENVSGKRRRIINATYRLRDLKQGLNQKIYIDDKIKKTLNDQEKYILKIREIDFTQKEKIYGPGEKYRNWLMRNPKYNFSKSKDIEIKHI